LEIKRKIAIFAAEIINKSINLKQTIMKRLTLTIVFIILFFIGLLG